MSCFSRLLCCCRKEPLPEKVLYAFDFDFTIVMKNSETIYKSVVAKVKGVPEVRLEDPPIPLKWDHISEGLAYFVFHECGVKLKDLLAAITEDVHFVPGMDILLEQLRDTVLQKNYNSQMIVLSGSNDLYIRTKLGTINIFPDEIISNHAILSTDGHSFQYKTHSNQIECRLCSRALCKGTELEKYFELNGRFIEVNFICDGTNDLCPTLKLRNQDTVFIREGYGLDNLLKKAIAAGKPHPVQAKIVTWKDGYDLLPKLLPMCKDIEAPPTPTPSSIFSVNL